MLIERPTIIGIPAPQGPYVPVVRVDNLLFLSGQGPIDPATNEFRLGTVQEQTRLVIQNLQTILSSCGTSLGNVVKCSVFIADPNDFSAMNDVYAEYFGSSKPARTTVVTMLVVPGMKVEIDCIASSQK
ncbi:MAG: RidA family protein [Acidobacteriaceae bacterium]